MSGDGLLLQEQPRSLGSSSFVTGHLGPRVPTASYHPHIPSNSIPPPPAPGANKRKRASKSNGSGVSSSVTNHSNDNRSSTPRTINSNNLVSNSHKRAKILKTSSSAPQLHSSGNAHSSNFLSSPDNRKRNKLGYHRTSVACGHCRRRKIRCLPSTDDISGRCANCIRLKKECTFFPVDQSNTQKSGSSDRPAKRQEHDSSATTAGPGSAPQNVHTTHYSHYPAMSRPQEYTFSPSHQPDIGIFSTSQAPPESNTASFVPGYNRSHIWDTSAFQNPSVSTTLPHSVDFHSPAGWKADPSIYPSQYIRPYSNYVPPTTLPTPHETYVTAQGSDIGWNSGPQRTMSMNQVDEKPSSETANNSQQSRVPRRSATLPHPPHRHMSEQSTATSISEPTPGPAITGSTANQSQMQSYVYPSPWTPSYGGNDHHFTEPRVYDEHSQLYDASWY